MRVTCDVNMTELEGDSGHAIEGVTVTCSKCGHTTESFGTSHASVSRCLVLLRQECPLEEQNFYVGN